MGMPTQNELFSSIGIGDSTNFKIERFVDIEIDYLKGDGEQKKNSTYATNLLPTDSKYNANALGLKYTTENSVFEPNIELLLSTISSDPIKFKNVFDPESTSFIQEFDGFEDDKFGEQLFEFDLSGLKTVVSHDVINSTSNSDNQLFIPDPTKLTEYSLES